MGYWQENLRDWHKLLTTVNIPPKAGLKGQL